MAPYKTKLISNVRPGYSPFILWLRSVANTLRTMAYFRLRCPWVKYHGFIRIPWSVEMWSPHKDIVIGNRVQFGRGCLVHCDAQFGNDILIARNVAFVGRDDHRFDIVGKTIWDSPRGDTFKVVVEDDVWIGHAAIILSGITIGRGSIIAAGSVVTDDIPRYSIAAGTPAKVTCRRFTEEEIRRHEAILDHYPRTFHGNARG
jgi:acetyltransferase-like isoleucine patch superfamily enzyme